MLGTEPYTSRPRNGCISVVVNGTLLVEEGQPVATDPGGDGGLLEGKRSGTSLPERARHDGKPGWANATITWCDEAEKSRVRIVEIHNNQEKTKSEPEDIQTPSSSSRLVHVIQVVSRPPSETDGGGGMNSTVVHQPSSESMTTRISVNCHQPHEVKGEDERSSSGASSAPGSDCERWDSDREDGADDGVMEVQRRAISYRQPPTGNKGNVTKTVVNGRGVQVTISSYAEKNSVSSAQDTGINCLKNGEQWDMQFHVHELDSGPTAEKRAEADAEAVQKRIAAAHAILSRQGSIRGLQNRVRSSIVSILGHPVTNRNYDLEEKGRIVFYTTTMGVVRETFERCRRVRKILETLMVRFEDRDVFMNRVFQQEVKERLGTSRVVVPQVFIEGRHLGSAEVLEQLNEMGELRELLRPYKKKSVVSVCPQCGGYRYLLCPVCGGSKKSTNHRHSFPDDLVALRCVTCDESGLIRCSLCVNGEG